MKCDCDYCIIYRYVLLDGLHLNEEEIMVIDNANHDTLSLLKSLYDEIPVKQRADIE